MFQDFPLQQKSLLPLLLGILGGNSKEQNKNWVMKLYQPLQVFQIDVQLAQNNKSFVKNQYAVCGMSFRNLSHEASNFCCILVNFSTIQEKHIASQKALRLYSSYNYCPRTRSAHGLLAICKFQEKVTDGIAIYISPLTGSVPRKTAKWLQSVSEACGIRTQVPGRQLNLTRLKH